MSNEDELATALALFKTMGTGQLKLLRQAHIMDNRNLLARLPATTRPTFSEGRVILINQVLAERGISAKEERQSGKGGRRVKR